MSDPSDVITSQHIASFQAVMNQVGKTLDKIKTKASGGIAFFKKRLKELESTETALNSRIKKIESGIGSLPRTDGSVTSLIDDLKAYKKSAEETDKLSHRMVYKMGKKEVKSVSALEAQVKSKLPQKSQGNASQALNDAVGGKGKDATKAGSGMLHASSGKTGVISCTVFFTRSDEKDGLETHVVVKAVGSHEDSKSYLIDWSDTPKLSEGKVFSL